MDGAEVAGKRHVCADALSADQWINKSVELKERKMRFSRRMEYIYGLNG